MGSPRRPLDSVGPYEGSSTRPPGTGYRGGLLVHWPIKDGPVPRAEVLRSLARVIRTCLHEGGIVYVHCQAGMNRSALVAARVLMAQGMTAEEAILRIRERRRGSLSDEYEDWLRSEEDEPHPDEVI